MARTSIDLNSMRLLAEKPFPRRKQDCLLRQLSNRQITGRWLNSPTSDVSSKDLILSHQPFMASWLRQFVTLEPLKPIRAAALCSKYSTPGSGFIDVIKAFCRSASFWINNPDNITYMLENLSKLREAVSMYRIRQRLPPDVHVEQEIFAVFLFYFNVPSVLCNMILATADDVSSVQRDGGSFSPMEATDSSGFSSSSSVIVDNDRLPKCGKVVCFAIELLRRILSSGEVKNDGTRRDEEHSRRFVVGELIHRSVASDSRMLPALFSLFLQNVGPKSMRYQVARLAEDCLVFSSPSTIEIPKLFQPDKEFKDVVANLPDDDLPLLCRLILPAICEFDAFGPPPHSLSKLHDFRISNADRLGVFDTNISFLLSLAGIDVPPHPIRFDESSRMQTDTICSTTTNNTDVTTKFVDIADRSNLIGRLLTLAVSPIVDTYNLPILPRPLTDSGSLLRPACEPGEFWTRYITARLILTRSNKIDARGNEATSGQSDESVGEPLPLSLSQDSVLAIRNRMTIFQFLSHALASRCRSSLQRYIAWTGIVPKLAPLIFSLRLGANIPDTAPTLFGQSSQPHFRSVNIVPVPQPHFNRRLGGPLSPDHVPDMLLSVVVLRFLHALCDHSPHRRQMLDSLDFTQIATFDPSDDAVEQVKQMLPNLPKRHGILTYICFSVVYHRVPADLWYWLIRVIEAYLRSAYPGDQMLVAYSGVLQRIIELILAPNGNGVDQPMRHQPSNLEVFQCSFDLLAEIVKFNVRLTNDADSLLHGPGQRYFVLRLVSENLVDANMFLRSLILTHAAHFHPSWFAGSIPPLSPTADTEPGELLRWIGTFEIRIQYIFSLVTCFHAGVASVTQDNISCLNTAILCLLLANRASSENDSQSHSLSEHCRHESLPAYLSALAAYRPSAYLPAPAAYRSENVAAAATWLASSSSASFNAETASRRRLLMATATDEAEYIVGVTWLRLFRDLLRFWRTHYLAKDKDSSSLARSTRIPFEQWHGLVTLLLDDSHPAPATSIARFLNTPFRAE